MQFLFLFSSFPNLFSIISCSSIVSWIQAFLYSSQIIQNISMSWYSWYFINWCVISNAQRHFFLFAFCLSLSLSYHSILFLSSDFLGDTTSSFSMTCVLLTLGMNYKACICFNWNDREVNTVFCVNFLTWDPVPCVGVNLCL